MTTPARKERPQARLWKPAFIAALRVHGIVTPAAAAAGIDRTTAYKARQRSEKFAKQWDDAIEEAIDDLEQHARRLARDGYEEPVYQGGALVGTKLRYSERLIELMLKAKRPEQYRENMQIEHSGNVGPGGPVKVEFVNPPHRAPDESEPDE